MTCQNDLQGRTYAKYADLKDGDIVQVDGDFTCLAPWSKHVVHSDGKGKYVKCSAGNHYLDGQREDDTDYLVGVYPVTTKPSVFVANYAFVTDLDADRDDPASKDMDLNEFAAPRFCGVEYQPEGSPPSEDFLCTMRDLVTNELEDSWEDDMPWHDIKWGETIDDGATSTFWLYGTYKVEEGPTKIGALVVQRAESYQT